MPHLLLLGETGTGKEVVARQAHQLATLDKAIIVVNCPAILEDLMESEPMHHSRVD